MRKYIKIITASIVFAGCSTTAFAGATDTAFKPTNTEMKISTVVKKQTLKKTVQNSQRLPSAKDVSTQSSRTVLFYSALPTRSKVISNKSATSTPNLFKK